MSGTHLEALRPLKAAALPWMQVESGAHTEADEDSDYLASADLEDDDDLDADADFIAEEERSPAPSGKPLSDRCGVLLASWARRHCQTGMLLPIPDVMDLKDASLQRAGAISPSYLRAAK